MKRVISSTPTLVRASRYFSNVEFVAQVAKNVRIARLNASQ